MDSQLQRVDSLTLKNLEPSNPVVMNSSSNLSNLCGENCNSTQPHYLVSTNSFELNAATSLSDDSGVPLTSSSISSGESYRLGICKFEVELVESDGEVSQFDSLDNCSDVGMSAENFNTLKKGPLAPIDPPPEFQDSPQRTLGHSKVLQDYAVKFSKSVISTAVNRWSSQNSILLKGISCELTNFVTTTKINNNSSYHSFNSMYNKQNFVSDPVLNKYVSNIYDKPNSDDCGRSVKNYSDTINEEDKEKNSNHIKPAKYENRSAVHQLSLSKLSEIHEYDLYYGLKKNYLVDNLQQRKTPVFYSPLQHHHHHNGNNLCTGNRPNSRNSLNSRLSSSHNSLSVPNANKADDSIFITQAMSHDALLSREILDFYNVPIDSDIYAFPIDMIKPNNKNVYQRSNEKQKSRLKYTRNNKRKKRSNVEATGIDKYGGKLKTNSSSNKRHSVPENSIEPLHMTLDEVKRFYHTLYSTSSDSSDVFTGKRIHVSSRIKNSASNGHLKATKNSNALITQANSNSTKIISSKCISNSKTKRFGLRHETQNTHNSKFPAQSERKFSIHLNLKEKFCSIFRFRKNTQNDNRTQCEDNDYLSNRPNQVNGLAARDDKKKFSTRALPPLPNKGGCVQKGVNDEKSELNSAVHLASSIEKVKDYGWYWGPISSEAAEKILSNEPDGSFIVRDSSDDHYIFSLSFKLNNCVRHVRIEQDQGTFSFGSYAKFKSQTITEFIEKAVEHSRSGRYLFFLHRRPEHGPMRVQLTNPVSRFKHIQSLQHMCRFVILKAVVRKDLIQTLPLPRRLLDYLSYKHCYSEQVESDSSQSQYGWYWGPISSEAAEKILSNEPDGSFIVRDSSDDHYIFSLSFKLNNCVRHVRIEQDQGTFSFGSYAKFKSQTITEFIEKAVEHSRSGRYLFFLHRRPEHGPMRVQLTNPVSRFKHIQSLQHMCRFVILKAVVRKDLIQTLPLPRRLLDYLSYKHCYSEQVESDSSQSQYGWYWGPISSEAAEKILSNEPDGSFIVRDSSDDHYIFSLSFKLNNCVRHVRIEQDQGTFSFGSYAKFKSQTITEFIEKAVEHSRSGRYLFFLHRRPEHGPMRVQLTNPVSRFKHIQSLQHMCRFVILKAVVRKDLIQTLPLPRRLLDYLSYKHCYSEQVESDSSQSQMSGDGGV